MYSVGGGEVVRRRWYYPRDNERNVVGALLHLGSLVLTTKALVQLDWFLVEASGSHCTPHLALHQFLKLGYFGRAQLPQQETLPLPSAQILTTPYVIQYHTPNQVLVCVTPEVVNLMRVLILLCLIGILCSMVGFCLDVIGPNKKALRFIRRNALPPIWTVITSVSIVGVCYLVSRSIELAIRETHPQSPVHITYQYGCYAVTAAGAVSLVATACNLLQDPGVEMGPTSAHRERLMEEFDGLETFSVGMRSLPPPPPYTP